MHSFSSLVHYYSLQAWHYYSLQVCYWVLFRTYDSIDIRMIYLILVINDKVKIRKLFFHIWCLFNKSLFYFHTTSYDFCSWLEWFITVRIGILPIWIIDYRYKLLFLQLGWGFGLRKGKGWGLWLGCRLR